MTPLKDAILHHKTDVISTIAAAEHSPEVRAEMFRLAQSMGNMGTIIRVVRVFPEVASMDHAKILLQKYLTAISSNYFGGGSPEAAGRRAWKQVKGQGGTAMSKDEPDFILSAEQLTDLRFLFQHLGLESESDVVGLMQNDA